MTVHSQTCAIMLVFLPRVMQDSSINSASRKVMMAAGGEYVVVVAAAAAAAAAAAGVWAVMEVSSSLLDQDYIHQLEHHIRNWENDL